MEKHVMNPAALTALTNVLGSHKVMTGTAEMAAFAGGAATTGRERVLEIAPKSLHQRVPLIAGSRMEVEHAARLHDGSQMRGERSPLFSRRGLLRF